MILIMSVEDVFVPLIIFFSHYSMFTRTFGYRVILGIFTSFRNIVINISANRFTGNG